MTTPFPKDGACILLTLISSLASHMKIEQIRHQTFFAQLAWIQQMFYTGWQKQFSIIK